MLFLVTLIAAVWMHLTVVSMLHKASPQLTNKFEHENDSEIPGEERTGANAWVLQWPAHPKRSGGEWLDSWDPENAETWDSRLAWKTLGSPRST